MTPAEKDLLVELLGKHFHASSEPMSPPSEHCFNVQIQLANIHYTDLDDLQKLMRAAKQDNYPDNVIHFMPYWEARNVTDS